MPEQVRIEMMGVDVTDRFTPLMLPSILDQLELSECVVSFYEDGEMSIDLEEGRDGCSLTTEDKTRLLEFLQKHQ